MDGNSVLLDRRMVMAGLAGLGGTMLTGCRPETFAGGMFMLSPAEERQLGLKTWEQIKTRKRPSSNDQLWQRVDQVGVRVVDASGATHEDWEFAVFEDDSVNAFALPGGKIAFYEGIFKVMDNDAQLACVAGHEVAHVNSRHGAKRISAQRATQAGLAIAAAALELGDVRNSQQIAALLGAGATYGLIMPYSREHEYEADRLGVEYMARAGYDPDEALDFWGDMSRQGGGGRQPEFFSTHPSDANRIAALQALLPAKRQIYQASRTRQT